MRHGHLSIWRAFASIAKEFWLDSMPIVSAHNIEQYLHLSLIEIELWKWMLHAECPLARMVVPDSF